MQNYVSYKDIVSQIDIQAGDVVNVSSDVLKLACVCRKNGENFDPNLFIDSILEKVGPKGTVLFPTYHWGFCRGQGFDSRNTGSETGSLSSAALRRNDFRRTKHPIYSFAVWGKDQKHLCQLNNRSAFAADSPFGYLYEANAKNLFVGIDYKHAFAFVHYVEEIVGVSYRQFKDFTGIYIDEQGRQTNETYRMYVRDLNSNAITIIHPKIDSLLAESGYYKKYSFNDVYVGLIDVHGAGDIMKQDVQAQTGLVYFGEP